MNSGNPGQRGEDRPRKGEKWAVTPTVFADEKCFKVDCDVSFTILNKLNYELNTLNGQII